MPIAGTASTPRAIPTDALWRSDGTLLALSTGMSPESPQPQAATAPSRLRELTRLVEESGSDPKDFLRRVMSLSALRGRVIGALLVEATGDRAWLARPAVLDGPLRAFFRDEGHGEASAAHAVDLLDAAPLDGPAGAARPVELDAPWARLVVARQPGDDGDDAELLDTLRLALHAWDLRCQVDRAREDEREMHRRVAQVRAGMRAARRIERALEDMDDATRWLLDLGEDFAADGVLALLERGDGPPLLLSAVQTTSSLEAQLAGWVIDRFEKEHERSVEGSVVWRRLRPGGAAPDEQVGPPARQPQPRDWPSRLAVPFATSEGRRGLVALGGRVPQSFAPESGGLLRSAAATLAQGISRVARRERQRRRLLQGVLEHLPMGLILVDERGDLEVVNAEAMRLLGLQGETPGTLEELEAEAGFSLGLWVEEILSSSEDRVMQEVLDRRDGLPPVHVDAGRIPATEGGRGDLLLALRDVSEEQRRERARSEFVNTVGHELKTPLTSMVTALEILDSEEAGALTDDQRRFVDLTSRNLQRLEQRIEQLLMIARQEGGRLVLRRDRHDLVGLLGPWLESTQLDVERQRRDFQTVMPSRAMAFVDGDRFAEIVENLVGNAFKFTPRERAVRLSLRTAMPCPVQRTRELADRLGVDVDGVEIEVVDQGAGMSAETAHHAFDPFYQEGDPLADRPEGAGLGLSIVRSLVEAHDGEIEVHSAVGEGTCMRVWTPATHDAARLHGGLRRLRRELDGLRRRGERARLELFPLDAEREADLAGLDQVEGAAGLLVRLGGEHLLRIVALATETPNEAEPRATVVYPEDGRRLGTLLAELLGRADTAETASARHERSRDE